MGHESIPENNRVIPYLLHWANARQKNTDRNRTTWKPTSAACYFDDFPCYISIDTDNFYMNWKVVKLASQKKNPCILTALITNHFSHSPFPHSPLYTLFVPSKICLIFVFHFPWVLQWSQEKLRTMLVQNFGGQTECIMGVVEMGNRMVPYDMSD